MKWTLAVLALLCCCAGQIVAQSAVEKEILAIEKQWIQAIMKHDITFIEKIIAPNYIAVDDKGALSTRQSMLDAWRKETKRNYLSFTPVDEKVFVTGETALYSYTDIIVQTKDGKKITEKVRGVDVFSRVNGKWMCVNMSFVILKDAKKENAKNMN